MLVAAGDFGDTHKHTPVFSSKPRKQKDHEESKGNSSMGGGWALGAVSPPTSPAREAWSWVPLVWAEWGGGGTWALVTASGKWGQQQLLPRGADKDVTRHLWLIHVDVWQKTKFCKAIILHFKNKLKRCDLHNMQGTCLTDAFLNISKWHSCTYVSLPAYQAPYQVAFFLIWF